MDHTVIALDLSSSPSRGSAASLLDILYSYDDSLVVSVSAFAGVEGWIAAAIESGTEVSEGRSFDGPSIISGLRGEHHGLAEALGAPAAATEAAGLRIDRILGGLWTLVACPAVGGSRRLRSLAVGEKLAAICVALALASLGRPTPLVEPSELGLAEAEPRAERIVALISPLPGAVVPGLRAAWPIASALGQGEPPLETLDSNVSARRSPRYVERASVVNAPTVA
jgi:hypothetical protein